MRCNYCGKELKTSNGYRSHLQKEAFDYTKRLGFWDEFVRLRRAATRVHRTSMLGGALADCWGWTASRENRGCDTQPFHRLGRLDDGHN